MIDDIDKENRMVLVRRIAIGLAKQSDDPILADTNILSRRTFQGKPKTEQELDSRKPVAVCSNGGRYFTHVRMDGRGQILVVWPSGFEETIKFWIPEAYLNREREIGAASPTSTIPSVDVTGSELEQAVGRIRAADPNFPISVSEISALPLTSFDEIKSAVSSGNFAIGGFSFHHNLMILRLVAPTAKPAYIVSMLATYLVPLVCTVLALTTSPWLWLGLLYFFAGASITTFIWSKAIISAALQSEAAFCLLFYFSKISLNDLTTSRRYDWQQIQKQPPRDARG
jgi:hypothetical protein